MDYCTHVYYGTGKGKTTAAAGLAVRAAGAGWNVLFCQFLKSGETSELAVLESIPGLTLLRPEGRYPFTSRMTGEDRRAITDEHDRIIGDAGSFLKRTLKEASGALRPGNTDGPEDSSAEVPVLVVLDELAWAFHYDLIDKPRALSLLNTKAAEFIITGRVGVPALLERADYITHFQEERHPYQRGLQARRGIEW